MNKSASINIEDRFQQPKDWVWGAFKNSQNQSLRYGSLTPEGGAPKAIVVLLPGRSEFIEKYFEIARDLAAQNLALWIIDWCGQGKSERPFRFPQRGNSPDFARHVADLNEFIESHVKQSALRPDGQPIPLIMLAQSMGGNIGLRYLHAHSGDFEAATICAPMLGLKDIHFLPLGLAVILVRILRLIFGLHSYAFGQKDWDPLERKNTDKFSHDKTRNAVHDFWYQADPALPVGGVTFSWLYHALKSCKILSRPKALGTIKTPILLVLAGHEELVDNRAIHKAARFLPRIQTLEFPESGHEILMEKDDIRDRFLTAFTGTIQEILDKRA